ncbi:MAG TPA: TIR domain-containing protein [Thermoanaerobaculia bacterium]|nr:TIR domain-containing protein [Thermoanaerobaculia bacterium]
MKVFVSYSAEADSTAARLMNKLRKLGYDAAGDSDVSVGDTVGSYVAEAISRADIVVLLLSVSSDDWFTDVTLNALTAALDERGVTCVPALVAPQRTIRSGWGTCVDLRRDYNDDIENFASNLVAAASVDFSRLDWQTFESTVAELLVRLGFSVQHSAPEADWCDFVARFPTSDPFGAEQEQFWCVETKHLRQQRLGVAELGKLLAQAAAAPRPCNALLVTDSRLTSVARDYVGVTSRKLRQELKVIERPELLRLLLRFPDLIQRLSRTDESPQP